MIISCSALRRMRNVSGKRCRRNQNTLSVYRALCDTMHKMVQPDRPHMTTYYGAYTLHAGYLRLQTHSEHVILIPFPLQQWLYYCPRPPVQCPSSLHSILLRICIRDYLTVAHLLTKFPNLIKPKDRGTKISPNSVQYLKIQAPEADTRTFHTEDKQILGASIKSYSTVICAPLPKGWLQSFYNSASGCSLGPCECVLYPHILLQIHFNIIFSWLLV